jgi:hypothetical protein
MESEDFSSYITLFHDELSEEKMKIIDELFKDKASVPAGGEAEEVV